MPNPNKLLEAMYGGAVRMQDGGKLPPGIKRATERAKASKSVLPVAGARQAREAIQGYIGMDPSYSVMDPEAESLASAYRGGETASVLGDLAGALSPFAYASAMSKVGQVPGIAELIAYHGSPHKFKKFDASKIGTGEGIQAYGHGLYFAENPNVASEYRRKLSALTNLVDGDVSKSNIDAIVGQQIQALGANKAKQYFLQSADQYERMGQSYKPALETAAKYRAFANHVDQLSSKSFAQNKGSLYKADLPDEKIAKMLDWDKPLSQQPKAVQEAINKSEYALRDMAMDLYGNKDPLGSEIARAALKPQEFAEHMRELGVPGIRYFDQGSRGTGKGTSNFVVFPGEEESIKMLEINGTPEMAKGGAVHMQDGGSMFNFNPMAAKAAKQKQMRESTPETPLGALARGIGTGLFGSMEDTVPYTGSIMEGTPERQQSQANLREIGRNIGVLTDIGGMTAPFAKPAAQAVTRGATALGRAGLEQVDRAMFGEGPLAALTAPVAPLQAAPRVQAPKAATIPTQEVTYETTTEGPFYRVRPSVSQAPAGQRRGTLESDGTQAGYAVTGGTGSDVPQPITNEAVQQVMADPANFVRRSADTYTQDVLGKPYELPEVSESSIFKQAPIGRAFMLAATDDPAYKKAIFEQYARQMPEVVEQSGAKNYDELLAASYRQLAKETDEQFKRLPISLSYHRAGEGNYRNSKQMLQDVYGNKHLYVFQGGDEHPYLKDVDLITGLNENEKFRAVHDFFGHAVHGNEFGPKGEEIAWAAHSQMYSPLARLAMSTETRGQNSTVNYTPLNAALKRTINELNMQRYEANRRGKTDLVKEIDGQLKEAWNGFQFAPQKPLLLPPEFISTKYEGEMPDYLRSLIRPEEGTFINKPMVHFSKQAGLTETDPAFYGTGIKGEEAARLGEKGSVRPRTYFYTDESVTPEPGLGPYRYRAMGENLYDLSADPLMLNMLARETTRIPMTASSNKGLAQPAEATNALERLIRDYGYAGYISPQSTKPSAVLFGKMPVTPYKQGGATRRVHISDNPDTMLLELMRAPRMQEGGSTDQFFGRTAPRGVSSLPGYGQGKEDVQQAITALEESPVGRIASGAGELAEGYMSGAGSTDLQKIGQGLSMIPMLGLPATIGRVAKTAKIAEPAIEAAQMTAKPVEQTIKAAPKSIAEMTAEMAEKGKLNVREPSSLPGQVPSIPAPNNIQPITTVQLPTGQFATTTGFSTVKPVRTGFDVAETPEQVAHLTAGLRKSPQEQLVAVVVDENNKPIQVIRHTVGLINQSSAEPFSLVGAIANTPGAKGFYISHNHPSGVSQLSNADERLADVLLNMTQDTGVQMRGMLAIGKDKFAFYDPLSKSSSKGTKIPPAIRNKSIDMVERTLKKAQVMDTTQFQGPKDIAKFADKFIGDQTGVLLLNNQHYPVGFMPIDAAQFSNLRKSGTAINILRGLEKANANNAVLISKGNIPPEEMQNIEGFFNASSVRLLDALTGPQRDSLSMKGSLGSTRSTSFKSAIPIAAGLGAAAMQEDEYKKGGKVRISNNLDAMRLELLRKKHA